MSRPFEMRPFLELLQGTEITEEEANTLIRLVKSRARIVRIVNSALRAGHDEGIEIIERHNA